MYKLFVPLNLGIVYDWPSNIFTTWFYISIALIIGVGFLVYKNKKNKLFIFGVLFFLFNIILQTTIFSEFLGPHADRYAYLSSIGVWVALISLVKKEKSFQINIFGFLLVALFFIAAKKQTTTWKDTITLWSNNLEHQKSTFSNGMRGNLYYEKKMFPQAKSDFEKVDKNPDPRFEPQKYAYLYIVLGMMTTEKDPQKSALYFSKSAEAHPILGNIQNAGIAFRKIGDYAKAETYFLKCLEINKQPKLYMNLSSLYFESKQFDKGIMVMSKAIQEGFEVSIFYKMRCFFRIEEQQFNLAVEDYKKVVELTEKSNNKKPDNELINLRYKLRDYL